jgi:hypothetical protein
MGKLIEVVGKVVQLDGRGLGVKVLGTLDWGKASDVGELRWKPDFLLAGREGKRNDSLTAGVETRLQDLRGSCGCDASV